jgi:hypothetical protein
MSPFRLIGVVAIAIGMVACQRAGSEVVVYTSHDQVFSEPVLKELRPAAVHGLRARAAGTVLVQGPGLLPELRRPARKRPVNRTRG